MQGNHPMFQQSRSHNIFRLISVMFSSVPRTVLRRSMSTLSPAGETKPKQMRCTMFYGYRREMKSRRDASVFTSLKLFLRPSNSVPTVSTPLNPFLLNP